MMKKRQIAIIPLLIACIVMLMSTVVPHHHHGKLICFTFSHCEQETMASSCHHDHDSNPTEKTCEVQQLFQTDIIKQHNSECTCCLDIIPDHLLFPLLALPAFDHSLLLIGQDQETPPPVYVERLHATAWSITCAGRAPPTAIA